MKIQCFDGKMAFLSNFWLCSFVYDNIYYTSAEAAFQAQKTLDTTERKNISKMNPKDAKRAGRKVCLRSDWEEVKRTEMYKIVKAKFMQNKSLADALLSTKDAYLEEGNTWGDTYWGVCNGKGLNWLGKILMQVREELQQELNSEESACSTQEGSIREYLIRNFSSLICSKCVDRHGCSHLANDGCDIFETMAEKINFDFTRMLKGE